MDPIGFFRNLLRRSHPISPASGKTAAPKETSSQAQGTPPVTSTPAAASSRIRIITIPPVFGLTCDSNQISAPLRDVLVNCHDLLPRQIDSETEQVLKNSTQILIKYNSPITENLLKLLAGAIKAKNVKTFDEFRLALLEITSQVLIINYLKGSNSGAIISEYEQIAKADNPHVSLSDPKAATIFQQVVRTHARAMSLRYAFSVLMFDSRRTPTGKPPLFARFGNDCAEEVHYINARDKDSFPGKGVSIARLIPERIFAPSNTEDPFIAYKEAWPHLKDDFDAIRSTNYIPVRGGFIITSPEDASHNIKTKADKRNAVGEETHYSLVVFNDHFGGKDFVHNGSETFCLVPTYLINKKFEGTLIPYKDFKGFDSGKKDINNAGFNFYELAEEGKRNGTPIIHLGTGSTFAGGFCNAFPPGQKWFYPKESELARQGGIYVDHWGHTHKGDITGNYHNALTNDMKRELKDFGPAHDKVYEVSNSLLNRLELFFLGYANWQKGFTVGEVPYELSAEGYLEDDVDGPEYELEGVTFKEGDPNEWKGDDSTSELTPYELIHAEQTLGFTNDPEEIRKNPNAKRMLMEALEWHVGGKERGMRDPNDYPILTVGPSTNLWAIPENLPFYIDTMNMTLVVGDETYQFNKRKKSNDDFEADEVWFEVIVPLLYADNALRFYDRRDLGIK